MTDATFWLTRARELQALAANGLTYTTDGYDRERYHRLHALAVEMLAGLGGGRAPEAIADLYLPDRGYVTPKVDVRAAVRDESGRLLLVRERSDGLWALPGGWADVGDSPARAAVRETAEEAGYLVEATGLVGLYDRDAERWHHPPHPYHVYKVVVACRLVGLAPSVGREGSHGEISEVGFFAPDDLPPLSVGRNSPALVARVLDRLADPTGPADLD
ncbi:MAG: NUDIX hydrolase [Acidothermales bacterium]|nr:NUDIX hydrolase [Acidothermales bacterium]